MSIESDTRDRVIRLEAKVEALERTVSTMAVHVSEMHSLLQQAKGAKYVIVGGAAITGFVSAKLAHFLPWFGGGNG